MQTKFEAPRKQRKTTLNFEAEDEMKNSIEKGERGREGKMSKIIFGVVIIIFRRSLNRQERSDLNKWRHENNKKLIMMKWLSRTRSRNGQCTNEQLLVYI